MHREYDGRQPDDPERAVAVIPQVAAMADPPFRFAFHLALGSDLVNVIEHADRGPPGDSFARSWPGGSGQCACRSGALSSNLGSAD
jgi:hypothetical protein